MPDKKKEEIPDKEVKDTATTAENKEETTEAYSDIITADGKRLKNIDGGYTISGTGINPEEESDFIAV